MIPTNTKDKTGVTTYFYGNGSIPQPYVVPTWATRLFIVCIGSGGGGGSGLAGVATRSGGGGGGGSGVTRLWIRTADVPQRLYVHVPFGGAGGTGSGGVGSAGGISYVTVSPTVIPANTLALSGNAGASGATGGTGVTGGTAGSVATIANMPLAGRGIYNFIAGQAGSDGNSGAAGNNLAIPVTSLVVQGGIGGGGVSLAGTEFTSGQILAITNSLLSEKRPAQTPAATNGSGGFNDFQPFFSFGGMGGGGSNLGQGGNGGNGIYGSGGGGGGGGTTAQSGVGGRGGDGLVIITAY